MGVRLQRESALETIDFCAGVRESVAGRCGMLMERVPWVPPVVLVAVAVAFYKGGSPKSYNPMADLSDAEYKRRYEAGRRRHLTERAARKAARQTWVRENGPWLLLAVMACLLAAVLGLTHPHRFIVITALALYGGLAWVVCWAVRASC